MSTIATGETKFAWRRGTGSLSDGNCSIYTELRNRFAKRRCVVRLGAFRCSKGIDGDIKRVGTSSIPQDGWLGKRNPVHGAHRNLEAHEKSRPQRKAIGFTQAPMIAPEENRTDQPARDILSIMVPNRRMAGSAASDQLAALSRMKLRYRSPVEKRWPGVMAMPSSRADR